MKISNEELKQIIKEELSNVLQEMNIPTLFALGAMAKKRKKPEQKRIDGFGRPRFRDIDWKPTPKPRPPMKQHPDTPKMPASSVEVDLDEIYSQVKAAADKTKESTEDQAMVYQNWLTGKLQSLGHSPDAAYDIMNQLDAKGLISFDEESGRVNFER